MPLIIYLYIKNCGRDLDIWVELSKVCNIGFIYTAMSSVILVLWIRNITYTCYSQRTAGFRITPELRNTSSYSITNYLFIDNVSISRSDMDKENKALRLSWAGSFSQQICWPSPSRPVSPSPHSPPPSTPSCGRRRGGPWGSWWRRPLSSCSWYWGWRAGSGQSPCSLPQTCVIGFRLVRIFGRFSYLWLLYILCQLIAVSMAFQLKIFFLIMCQSKVIKHGATLTRDQTVTINLAQISL